MGNNSMGNQAGDIMIDELNTPDSIHAILSI